MGQGAVYISAVVLLFLTSGSVFASAGAGADGQGFSPSQPKVMPATASPSVTATVIKDDDANGFLPPENHEPKMAVPDEVRANTAADTLISKEGGGFSPPAMDAH